MSQVFGKYLSNQHVFSSLTIAGQSNQQALEAGGEKSTRLFCVLLGVNAVEVKTICTNVILKAHND